MAGRWRKESSIRVAAGGLKGGPRGPGAGGAAEGQPG